MTKNHGLQKVCPCGHARWLKCRHSWYLRWTPPGQKRLQIKIDDYAGRHIELKSVAEALVIEIKTKVKDGTYTAAAPLDGADRPMSTTTLGEMYFASAVNKRTGKPLKEAEQDSWRQLCAVILTRPRTKQVVTIGEIPAASLTTFDVEAFRTMNAVMRQVEITDARGRTYTIQRGGLVSTNRIVGRWRAVYAWALKTGLIETSPFSKAGVSMIDNYGERRRERRLEEGEREKLLAYADPEMRDLIEVALGTGCRLGELIALRWHQVRWLTNEIAIEGKQTKTSKPRVIPMLADVRVILERRRLDPDGQPYGPLTFIFGDVTGAKRGDIKTAWTTIRLKAAGFTGQIRDVKTGRLTPAAQQALKAYDLHFHDLRREAASRFMDEGMDPRAVQTFLDHASLSTTSTYLRLGQKALHREAQRIDEIRKQRQAAKLVSNGIPEHDPS